LQERRLCVTIGLSAGCLVANMDDGPSAEEVIESYCLRTPLADVLSAYAYAKRQLAHSA